MTYSCVVNRGIETESDTGIGMNNDAAPLEPFSIDNVGLPFCKYGMCTNLAHTLYLNVLLFNFIEQSKYNLNIRCTHEKRKKAHIRKKKNHLL